MQGALTGPKDGRGHQRGECSPRTSTEPLLKAHPTSCQLCCGAASVPVPIRTLAILGSAVGCELLITEHIIAPLQSAAEKAAFMACPADIKGSF